MKTTNNSTSYSFILCCVVLMCPFIFLGCASKSPQVDTISQQEKYARYFQEQHKAVLMPVAESALGVPYKFGGTTINGFDCSGFVRWAYSHAGIYLPRTAREQSKEGEAIKNKDDLQVGDIVAFYNKRRGYHTGIYVGDGKFVHSPRRRKTVEVTKLSTPYFSNSFLGARRVVQNIKESEIDAAMELIKKYEQDSQAKAKPKKSKKRSS